MSEYKSFVQNMKSKAENLRVLGGQNNQAIRDKLATLKEDPDEIHRFKRFEKLSMTLKSVRKKQFPSQLDEMAAALENLEKAVDETDPKIETCIVALQKHALGSSEVPEQLEAELLSLFSAWRKLLSELESKNEALRKLDANIDDALKLCRNLDECRIDLRFSATLEELQELLDLLRGMVVTTIADIGNRNGIHPVYCAKFVAHQMLGIPTIIPGSHYPKESLETLRNILDSGNGVDSTEAEAIDVTISFYKKLSKKIPHGFYDDPAILRKIWEVTKTHDPTIALVLPRYHIQVAQEYDPTLDIELSSSIDHRYLFLEIFDSPLIRLAPRSDYEMFELVSFAIARDYISEEEMAPILEIYHSGSCFTRSDIGRIFQKFSLPSFLRYLLFRENFSE